MTGFRVRPGEFFAFLGFLGARSSNPGVLERKNGVRKFSIFAKGYPLLKFFGKNCFGYISINFDRIWLIFGHDLKNIFSYFLRY